MRRFYRQTRTGEADEAACPARSSRSCQDRGCARRVRGRSQHDRNWRARAAGGAILAALGGVWFVAGRAANMVWPHLGVPGAPAGTSVRRVLLEEFGFFTGLGIVIVFFAALALGGCLVAAFRVAGPGARDAVADDALAAGAATYSATTSGFVPSTAGSRVDSGNFMPRTADAPGGLSYFPPRWDDVTE